MSWIPGRSSRRWDLVSLGEVMLRLDPGDTRITTARSFQVWEGGAEYNVARALTTCFGLDTAIVTALAENPVGRLIDGLIAQGGVARDHIQWRSDSGLGVRNALNFVERGFGVRAALSCSDRRHSASSQLTPGDIDWDTILEIEGTRWLHCGGVFAGLSGSTAAVAEEALHAARRRGVVTSLDLNYRSSLWEHRGGMSAATKLNRKLADLADVLVGSVEDFSVRLTQGPVLTRPHGDVELAECQEVLESAAAAFPETKLFALTLRDAATATRNRWTAACLDGNGFHGGHDLQDLEICDRVGGGDAFAAGLIYGLLDGRDTADSLNLGIAHGALAMTTPGDSSMATRSEVERLADDTATPAQIAR